MLGASGPERATTLVPTSTATVVVDTARPFTTISVVAECRSFGPAAKEPLGACAGDFDRTGRGSPGCRDDLRGALPHLATSTARCPSTSGGAIHSSGQRSGPGVYGERMAQSSSLRRKRKCASLSSRQRLISTTTAPVRVSTTTTAAAS